MGVLWRRGTTLTIGEVFPNISTSRYIRSDIRNGILEAGSRLPAKRSLAAELSVSVSTV